MLEGVACQDFKDKGAEDIKKYKCFQEEGYGFIHVVNSTKDATFKEKVNYPKFEGLEMCKPQQGAGYDITVGPGLKKTILIRCDPEGYGMSSSSNT